jgi:multidrug resistance efflux pump
MKTAKIVGTGVLLVAVIAGGWFYLGGRSVAEQAAAQSVTETVQVERGPIVETISSVGTVAATTEAAQADLAAASLATAQASLAQTQKPASDAEIASAQAALASAQASLDELLAGPTDYDLQNAQLTVDSAKNQLWSYQAQRDATAGSRAASDAQKDAAEAQVLVAEVAVQQAELALQELSDGPTNTQVAAARAQVAQAQAQLSALQDQPSPEAVNLAQAQVVEAALALSNAQDALDDATLTAPFDGTILSIDVEPGEWVTASVAVAQIAGTSGEWLEVMLDEADVPQVAEGQAATITFDALPDTPVEGTVTEVRPSPPPPAAALPIAPASPSTGPTWACAWHERHRRDRDQPGGRRPADPHPGAGIGPRGGPLLCHPPDGHGH